MNSTQTRRFEMFKRVQQFGVAQRSLFPEGSLAAQMFTEVGTAVTELAAQAVSREMARGEGVDSKARTRAVLVRQLAKVRQTAQVLAIDKLGVGDGFGAPRRRTAESLVTSARTFVRDAEPFAADFIAHGLPATFLADLSAAADAAEQAQQLRLSGSVAGTQARQRISAALAAGRTALSRLDAIVENLATIDEPTRATWRELRRIGPRVDRRNASPPASKPVVTTDGATTSESSATPADRKLVA